MRWLRYVCFLLKVGFIVAHLVDKGATAVIRAGRVHKDFEGRKIISLLGQSVGYLAIMKGAKVLLSVFGSSGPPKQKPQYKRISNLVKYFIIRHHDKTI